MDELEISLSPQEILNDPLLNKGTGFTQEERDLFGLHGFLPYHCATIEDQVKRRYENFKMQRDEISKYLFLSALQNRNETLFYRLVSDHITEMLPYIYTPTVGSVSLQFSALYREPRGLYLSYPLKDRIDQMVDQIPQQQVDVIVVTDGERILGLGDLGVGGMAISIGKLSLYTIFGGIHPARVLPVVLDVGTNNEDLLKNPSYVGWKHHRIAGKEYDDFVEAFVRAIQRRYPHVLLQWEDFAKAHAKPLLDRYKQEICSFNDDIQGTAAIVLAALLAAVKAAKGELSKQRIVVAGGGNAGLGVCEEILRALINQGIPEKEAKELFYIVDRFGLIHDELQEAEPDQKKFAQHRKKISSWKTDDPVHITLTEVVKHVKPTILIGLSAQPGLFTEEIVKQMARGVEQPIIFPLSNPTSKCEASPEQLIHWTKGKAIVATGSPFSSVFYENKEWQIPQCNNVYIYPGVGIGIIATQSSQVVEEMFLEAARVISEHAPLLKDPSSPLFPPFTELRKISRKIGIAVAKVAISKKLARRDISGKIEESIDQVMWEPRYPVLKRASKAF